MLIFKLRVKSVYINEHPVLLFFFWGWRNTYIIAGWRLALPQLWQEQKVCLPSKNSKSANPATFHVSCFFTFFFLLFIFYSTYTLVYHLCAHTHLIQELISDQNIEEYFNFIPRNKFRYEGVKAFAWSYVMIINLVLIYIEWMQPVRKRYFT